MLPCFKCYTRARALIALRWSTIPRHGPWRDLSWLPATRYVSRCTSEKMWCRRFEWVHESATTLEVIQLYPHTEATVVIVLQVFASPEINLSNPMRFAPFALSPQIYWSVSGCNVDAAVALVGDEAGVVIVDISLAPRLAFGSAASGSTVRVCYRFNSALVQLYKQMHAEGVLHAHRAASFFGAVLSVSKPRRNGKPYSGWRFD